MVALVEVFGLNRAKNPLSYVVRDVERDFRDSLADPALVALIVYGTSKQGKTSLLRSALTGHPHITVQGNRSTQAEAVYRELLNQCSVAQDAEKKARGNGEIEFGAPWFRLKIGAGGEVKREAVQVDLGNASSVARVLGDSTDIRLIVIDNFHYFDLDVQRDIATAIRSFEAHGFKFVIIGTWNESRYLHALNQDLLGTTKEFSFDVWDTADLHKVLERGTPHLGVSLAAGVRQSLVHRSVSNVALLQELTKSYLQESGVRETVHKANGEGSVLADVKMVEAVANNIQERLKNDVINSLKTITGIGDVFYKGRTRSFWILTTFLQGNESEVVKGMRRTQLLARTNQALAKAFQSEEASRKKKGGAPDNPPQIGEAEFGNLIKAQWLNEQQKQIRTPVLLYVEAIDSMTVCDSWTKFVLRSTTRRDVVKAL